FVIWATSGSSEPVALAEGQRSVLCVGDSFTWGLGASDRDAAYPAVVQRELQAAGLADVRCLNLGWPGQDSARVLARLDGQLRRHGPALVYVLVGYNDFWSAGDVPPAAGDEPAESAESFVLELRTLKLARMVAAALAGGPGREAGGDAPFVGPWHDGPLFFDFVPDGSILTANGAFDGVWSVDGERIVVEARSRDEVFTIGWRIDGNRLTLSGGPFGAGAVLTRGMPSANAYQRGIAALRAGDPLAAERELRAALGEPEQRFDALLALVRMLADGGRQAEAEELLPELERAAAPEPGPGRTAALADARFAVGDDAGALRLLVTALRHQPIDDELAKGVVRRALRLAPPELDEALAAAAARSDLSIPHRVALLGVRASLEPDPDAAADALVEVARLQPEGEGFVRAVRWHPDRFPRERFVARAARLPPEERAAVVAAYDRAAARNDRTGDVLVRNVTAIVRAIREAGATPILMTYPGS